MGYIFDTNALVSMMSSGGSDSLHQRLINLINGERKKRHRIIVPTPALAEFAIKGQQHELDFLVNDRIFHLAAFDSRAAIEFSINYRAWDERTGGSEASKRNRNKHKAKFDLQILAIAKAHSASTIVTNDVNLLKFAAAHGVKSVRIADLPMPETDKQLVLELSPQPAAD